MPGRVPPAVALSENVSEDDFEAGKEHNVSAVSMFRCEARNDSFPPRACRTRKAGLGQTQRARPVDRVRRHCEGEGPGIGQIWGHLALALEDAFDVAERGGCPGTGPSLRTQGLSVQGRRTTEVLKDKKREDRIGWAEVS